MLAESIHSVADTANEGLLLLGGVLSRRRETVEHPFGYGRERYFWAFVVALVIFSMGSVFAVYEGVDKLIEPHRLKSPIWAVGILLVAMLLEAWSLRTAAQESNRARGNLGWWAFIRRSKIPELPVVLLEDLGALVGLLLALAGVGLATFTGDPRFDAMGSLAIGVLLFAIAVVLAIEMRSLLIGESASRKVINSLRATIESHPPVRRLIHMRTEHIGPEELLVAVKVEFDRELGFDGVCSAINAMEVVIRQAVPIARVIYIEPDIYRPAREDEPPDMSGVGPGEQDAEGQE